MREGSWNLKNFDLLKKINLDFAKTNLSNTVIKIGHLLKPFHSFSKENFFKTKTFKLSHTGYDYLTDYLLTLLKISPEVYLKACYSKYDPNCVKIAKISLNDKI